MRATTHRQRAWALALTAALLLSGCASLQPEPVPEPVKEAEAAPVPKAEGLTLAAAAGSIETRPAYIRGSKGFFQPDKTITRAEIAQIFFNLELFVPGERTFSDIAAGSWYHDAVAALSGALKGYTDGTFRPDRTATVAEFLAVICRVLTVKLPERAEDAPWYQPHWDTAQDLGWLEACPDVLPDTPLRRDTAVTILNRALGRVPDTRAIDSLENPVFLDVGPEHPAYYDILEAAVAHECDLDRDTWITETLTPPQLRQGLHTLGGSAYYVLEDGSVYVEPGLLEADGARYLVADETGRIYADGALHLWGEDVVFATETGALLTDGAWHDFYFDSQGVYTTGDAELDGYIDEVMAACTDETMTRAEKLRACYDYVRAFGYLGRNSTIYVKTMSPDQASAYAKKIFATGKGDCYNFAAAFYYLARALGYDATAVVGTCGYVWNTHAIPHGWVTIPLDGGTYLFDPQIENYNNRNGISNDTHSAYQVTYATAPANYYPN